MMLSELAAAYARGEVTEPVFLDNDQVAAYKGDTKVFDSHPEQVLEDALTALGIPWEHV
jgi:hypothetical protein